MFEGEVRGLIGVAENGGCGGGSLMEGAGQEVSITLYRTHNKYLDLHLPLRQIQRLKVCVFL